MRFPGVTLFFQLFPGNHGHDADRGIADVPFRIFAGGRPPQDGRTGPDGSISVPLQQTDTEFDIEIFGVRTHVSVVEQINPPASPAAMDAMVQNDTADALRGIAERLALLGYLDKDAPGQNTLDAALDKAILDFQVNEGMAADGVVGPGTLAALRQRAGV